MSVALPASRPTIRGLTRNLVPVRRLIEDSFRHASASGIVWLILGATAVCILVCFTAIVTVDTVSGTNRLVMGFGAIRGPASDDEGQAVRAVQLQLAGWVADAAGIMLALIWTAGFLPAFLEGNAVSVLLAKPVPRWSLLTGSFAGVVACVLFQAAVFIGGSWMALGFRTSVWNPAYLVCIPVLLLHFTVFFSFSALLAATTRSTAVCVFGSILFWLICWGVNFGRHSALLIPELAELSQQSALIHWTVEGSYWLLPKPLDFHLLLANVLQGGDSLVPLVDAQSLGERNAWHPGLSLLSSAATGALLLAMAAYEFVTADY